MNTELGTGTLELVLVVSFSVRYESVRMRVHCPTMFFQRA